MSHLLIISHTDHYLNENGEPCGWTSTVKELDFLAKHFDKITHLAVLHKKSSIPKSVTSYDANNIDFVGIPSFGGPGLMNKLRILFVLPILFVHIFRLLIKVDMFQFRAPTSIGIFVIPYLSLFFWKKGWFKYAGNWVQENKPLSYRIQKWMLEKMQRRPVTINGHWANQKPHCHTFENPCLNQRDLMRFKEQTIGKTCQLPLEICFVGRLDSAKGVDRIVKLLQLTDINKKIKTMHFVGDSNLRASYQKKLDNVNVDCVFHGFLPRKEVFEIYKKCQGFFLPSDSEGFPKVIAEAAAFGCIPFVSDVSSIGQYVNTSNGYLWRSKSEHFEDFFISLELDINSLKLKKNNVYKLAHKFTFEHYLSQLQKIILK